MTQMKNFYRLDEVAREFGVSRRTVERLVKSGELQSLKIGGGRRIALEELERLKKNEPKRV